MAASPSPAVPVPDTGDLTTFGAEVVVAVGLLIAGGAVMALVMLRLARHQPTVLVAVSLSILTLCCILLYGATESEALLGLAGTGLGALSTSLVAAFKDHQDRTSDLWRAEPNIRDKDKPLHPEGHADDGSVS